MAKEKDYKCSGYLNFNWLEDERQWSVGGNYTDEKGVEWELGWVKTGSQNLQEAIALVAKQMNPTLAGKGVPRKPRDRTQGRGPG